MVTDILVSSRRKKRKKSILKIWLFFAGIFVLAGTLVGFFYLPKFRINEIIVRGANVADEDELKEKVVNFLKGKIFEFLPADNIFLLPKVKMTAAVLQNFPVLKKVDIERDSFQKISIVVEERKPAALLCNSQNATSTDTAVPSCGFMDKEGFVFQPAPSFSGGIFVKFIDERLASSSEESAAIGKETISQSELQKLLAFEKLLDTQDMAVSEIILKNGGEYEVCLKEAPKDEPTGQGWRILLNSKNDPVQSFNNLMLVLESNIKEKRPRLDYLDLRFGNKVFFKYK